MIDIGSIFATAIILFILGFISTLILGFDLPALIVKAVYFTVIILFYLNMVYSNQSDIAEGVIEWTDFFINTIIPMIIGEAIGDTLASMFS